MSRKQPRLSVSSHIKYETDSSKHDFDENVMIPNPDKSGSDDSDSNYDSDSDSDSERDMKISNITYREALETYSKTKVYLRKMYSFEKMVKKYTQISLKRKFC